MSSLKVQIRWRHVSSSRKALQLAKSSNWTRTFGQISRAALTNSPTKSPDRGRVHDGHHLFQVLEQHTVEERLVAILQADEMDVPLEVGLLPAVVLDHSRDLLLQREDHRGEQTLEPQRRPLVLRERRALVEERVVEQLGSPGQAGPGPEEVRILIGHGVLE